ncbi:SDR family NAD(P)-dependent oxidoreductase [Paracoccaceae bacterium GXU_MW_L88]
MTEAPKSVLVTGASRGLGLAICRRLVAEGYHVTGVSRSHSDAFKEVAEKADGRLDFIPFDVAELDGIPELVNGVVKKHGGLWGMVNNAGIGSDGVLATQHKTDIEKVIQVNLTASIIFAKYACRPMLAARAGRIINISSIIATTGFHGLAAYAASKAGLEGFTRSLSRELGKRSVTVNCVAPGYMETEMTGGLDDHKMASIRRRAPLGLPEVDDVAGAVSYLIGPDGVRVTGSIVTVDGGSTA